VSVVNSKKVIGATELELEQKVRLKNVTGSIVQTHGSVKDNIIQGNISIPFEFQLVSHPVDRGRWNLR
jgi:hypothetical protein